MPEVQVKPSKIKRDARKKRFELIMPGGRVDTAFTRLFNVYKKLDDRLGAARVATERRIT